MSKQATTLKSMAELKARKIELRAQLSVAQDYAIGSVAPVRSRLNSFVLSKIAPVAAVGAGLFFASKIFGGNDDDKETKELKISDAQLAFLEAERRERVEANYAQQQATTSSPGFVSMIRSFLPFIKVLLPLIQATFASFQAVRATDIAESASAKADSASEASTISAE